MPKDSPTRTDGHTPSFYMMPPPTRLCLMGATPSAGTRATRRWRQKITFSRRTRSGERIVWHRPRRSCMTPERRLICIFDVGLRTIATSGCLGVPAAVLVFVFDDLRVARHALLGRGGAGRREGLSMGRIRLREYTVHRVRPAVVVPDDLIRDMRHRIHLQ